MEKNDSLLQINMCKRIIDLPFCNIIIWLVLVFTNSKTYPLHNIVDKTLNNTKYVNIGEINFAMENPRGALLSSNHLFNTGEK